MHFEKKASFELLLKHLFNNWEIVKEVSVPLAN